MALILEKCVKNLSQADEIITKWDNGYRESLSDLECIMIKIGLIKINDFLTDYRKKLVYKAKFLTKTDEEHKENTAKFAEAFDYKQTAHSLIERIDGYLGIHLNMLSDEELLRYALVLKGNDHG